MVEHPCIRMERTRLKKTTDSIRKMQSTGQYPQEFSMPIGVQYELTGACNLKCKHCYNRSGDQDVKTLMQPEDWIRLSHHIVENGGVFQCILSGGEPLLMGKTLLEIMDIFHEDGTGFLLISNGVLMNEDWVKKFRKYSFYWIQISLDDSIREKHDEFRGRPGTWEDAVRAGFAISSAGLPLVVAHTVTPQNLSRLPEMVELAYQMGANSILCGEIIISGRAAKDSTLWFNEKQRNIMYSSIESLKNEWAGKINVRYSIPESIELKTRVSQPNRAIIVRPNGDMRLDCTVPFTIGNVLETPFAETWRERGIHCWESTGVQNYIEHLVPGVKNEGQVNHVSPDQRLFNVDIHQN